jgi:hypothetical protein
VPISNSGKMLFIMISSLLTILITDTTLSKISNLGIYVSSSAQIQSVFFTVAALLAVLWQYLILAYIKAKSKEIRSKMKLHISTIHIVVTIAQYFIASIVIAVVLQFALASHYSTIMLTIATGISYTLSTIMLGLLAQQFFSWFKSNRNSVVLSYALSAVMIAANAVFTLILVVTILSGSRPTDIFSHIGVGSLPIDPGSILSFVNNAFFVSSLTSFMFTWIATALVLRHYSRTLGRIKFWVILSLPLVYFLSQFLTLFLNLFAPLIQSNPVFFTTLLTIIFASSQSIGGILFAVAFWLVSKKIPKNNVLRDYIIISAIGIILLFTSNQASVLVNVPYPPLGLVTISFMGLSSYLVLLGLYSAAISVSQDLKLRKSIRNSAEEQLRLFDSIGKAHMEQEIERKVINITREYQHTMIEETGVYSSMTEDEVKQYLHHVLQEIQSK